MRVSSTGNEYEFANTLLPREPWVAKLSPERTADLHRAAAYALQKEAGERPDAYLEIARHLLAGRSFSKAYIALVELARQEIAKANFDAAKVELGRAQKALAAQDGVSGLWDSRVAVLWQLELEIALKQGELELARERVSWLEMAAKRQQNTLWEARALLGKGQTALSEGELEEANRVLRLAKSRLQELAPERARNQSLIRVCFALADLGFFEELHLAQELLEDFSFPSLEAELKLRWAERALEEGEEERAKELLTESYTAAKEEGELSLEAEALRLRGLLSRRRGDVNAAATYFEEAIRCYEAMQQLEAVALCHQQLGELFEEKGALGDAQAHQKWQQLLSSK